MNSIWNNTSEKAAYPSLKGNIKTDVLIVGGGMAGVLIANKLKESGIKCVICEANEIGGKVTGNTTAKITAQHGLIYSDLIKRFGIEKARQYYDANIRALDKFRELSKNIAFDFEEKTAYVYTIENRKKLELEAKAYQNLGLSSRIIENIPLPIKTGGAIAMEYQAQFHPLKLLYSLAKNLDIYEHTFIREIIGNKAYTDNGNIIAKKIVLATHYPLINIPGLYFLKLYQHRSYVIALENAPLPDGMYLDEQKDGLSFRTYKNLLFIGGGDHKTGKTGGGYDELRTFARRIYSETSEKYHWATQDCMTLDNVPYIGKHKKNTENLYVATGFNKWGMTGSMTASEIIHDLIVNGKSELAELYSPQRSMLSSQFFINMGAAAKGLLSVGGPRCAHMGCKLHYNKIEKSWDCACHGSRFDMNGNVLENPAKRDIKL